MKRTIHDDVDDDSFVVLSTIISPYNFALGGGILSTSLQDVDDGDAKWIKSDTVVVVVVVVVPP